MGLPGFCTVCGAKLYFGKCLKLTSHVAIEESNRKGGKRKGAGKKPKNKDNGKNNGA